MTYYPGDVVWVKGYCGLVVLECVDEFLSDILHKRHWQCISQDYLQGNVKTNNIDPISEDEIIGVYAKASIEHKD